MLWPLTKHRHVASPQLAQRIDALRAQNPESERWLALVEAAFTEAAASEAWADAVVAVATEHPARASLLHGSEITVNGRALRRWFRKTCELAGDDNAAALEPSEILEGAICQDDQRLDTTSSRVIAQITALPLLQTCGRALKGQIPPHWSEGYCPVCGAWPTLAEFRGLERKRWLRCGRCASSWEMQWLRCPYCAETDHTNLGFLAPEEGETTRKVEVCDRCKGYVKSEPTVKALAPWEIVLDDLAMLPLELAALDRGYHRPELPGYALRAKVLQI